MTESSNMILSWIREHSSDQLVDAARILATSNRLCHEEAFTRIVEIIAGIAGVREFSTNAEARSVERAIRNWLGMR